MKSVLALFLGYGALLFAQGCSGGSTLGGPGLGDGGVVSFQLDGGSPGSSGSSGGSSGSSGRSGACGSCTSAQICVNQACQDLPSACPCPLESYCELATQTCKPTTAGSTSGGGSSSGASSSGSSGGSSSGASSSGSSGSSSGGSSSSSSGGSSGGSSSGGPAIATWSKIYTTYLAAGTIGNCAKSGCHSQMSTSSLAYSWLSGKGYIAAVNAPLADPNQSCLSWLGGNMPPSGPTTSVAAVDALTSWAAAGAPNN